MNTEEQIAELLKPRYKVIADYPLSKMYFNVGDVLCWNERFESYRIDEKFVSMNKDTVESYPHLFQPLPWYAERKPEEMPGYLKYTTGKEYKPFVVYPAKFTKGENGWIVEVEEHIVLGNYLKDKLPATESEYLSYINSKP